ncbi:MAG: type II toxin-antitoxin system HicB family antitoxin [Candidatus Omnitrophota bacterium]
MLKRFKVIIEAEIEAGGYSAHVPALPGCASQGESIRETLGNIKEAVKLYIWSLKDDGLPIPKSDVNVVMKEIEVSV